MCMLSYVAINLFLAVVVICLNTFFFFISLCIHVSSVKLSYILFLYFTCYIDGIKQISV